MSLSIYICIVCLLKVVKLEFGSVMEQTLPLAELSEENLEVGADGAQMMGQNPDVDPALASLSSDFDSSHSPSGQRLTDSSHFDSSQESSEGLSASTQRCAGCALSYKYMKNKRQLAGKADLILLVQQNRPRILSILLIHQSWL